MKKEDPNPIALEIKSLSKKFKCLGKDNIRIIHQFCQYDLKRTFKVMTIVQEMKNPASVIETLVKNSQKSEQIISQFLFKFDKLYDKNFLALQELKEEIKVKQEVKISELTFFQFVPNDTLVTIMSYLDPYSFFNFSITQKRIQQLSESQAQSDYYKTLCMKIFKIEPPRLPFISRFLKIREYVLNRPHQFKPNTRNAVLNNLRSYVWKMDMNSFNLEPSYFKSFGSYKKLYKNCPLVNKNGYYVLRDKYVKVGEKDERHPVTPIHIIYYYRYLRFLEDGSVLYHVRNVKLKPEQTLNFLGKQILEEPDQRRTMIGEFIHHKNKVFVRTVQNREVFSYQLQISSTQNKINNSLRVIKYTLDLVDDEQQIHQTLYATNPKKEDIYFNYCRNGQIASENSPEIQGVSL